MKSPDRLSRTVVRLVYLALILTALTPMTGCAVFNDDNRRTLNALDERISPQSTAAQAALAPVAVPVATGAVLVDGLLVNPAYAVAPAWDDTYELYWKPREVEPLTRAMLFIPIVVLTPPTYVGSWLIHSFLYEG
jgi:hypothetical protein